jgi:hypothetical protein
MPGQTMPATASTSMPLGTPTVFTNGVSKHAYNTFASSSSWTTMGSRNWPDMWSEKQKEALTKMEMTYDEEKKEWNLRLSIDIRFPQEVGMAAYVAGNGSKLAMDQLIEKLKSAKKQLVEKLTSKIILAELIKPREINK